MNIQEKVLEMHFPSICRPENKNFKTKQALKKRNLCRENGSRQKCLDKRLATNDVLWNRNTRYILDLLEITS